MRIGEVSLQTNDVNRLADFYKWLLSTDNGSRDEEHQVILEGETALTVYNDGSRKNNCKQNTALAVPVADVGREYQRLLDRGVLIVEGPTQRPWGAKNLHFLDPGGNHVYFRSFPGKEADAQEKT